MTVFLDKRCWRWCCNEDSCCVIPDSFVSLFFLHFDLILSPAFSLLSFTLMSLAFNSWNDSISLHWRHLSLSSRVIWVRNTLDFLVGCLRRRHKVFRHQTNLVFWNMSCVWNDAPQKLEELGSWCVFSLLLLTLVFIRLSFSFCAHFTFSEDIKSPTLHDKALGSSLCNKLSFFLSFFRIKWVYLWIKHSSPSLILIKSDVSRKQQKQWDHRWRRWIRHHREEN